MRTVIPLFFTFDRRYTVAAAVAFHSLLRHADPAYRYRLYVLHTDLSPRRQRALRRVVAAFPHAELHFIDTTPFAPTREAGSDKGHFSREIYYKLIAAKLFPQYDRIICSDVDVLFMGDVAPSYFAFPGERFFYAGVGQITKDARMATYGSDFTAAELEILRQEIAAGYMLLNLAEMRAHNMQQRLTQYYKANYHRLRLPEQDCLILCCWPHVRQLSMHHVVCNNYYTLQQQPLVFNDHNASLPPTQAEREALFADALSHPVQLHYVGALKPWNSLGCPKQRLWFGTLTSMGWLGQYLTALPAFAYQRLKRYSLKRFLGKQLNKYKKKREQKK